MPLSISDIWEEWKRLTRFLECSKIAFQRELRLWDDLEIDDPSTIRLSTQTGLSRFALTADQHIETLRDEELLYFIVLTYSYSLCERYARIKLGIAEHDRLTGGIENWGEQLINLTGNSWSGVLGGKSGIIEVAVVRNFLAHGTKVINPATISRFSSAGVTCPWTLGENILLTYEKVEEYRSRLKSLMRYGNN